MTKPSDFISTTDFATLKNDAGGNGAVTVPSGTSVAGSGAYYNSVDLTIGVAGSIVRGQIASSKASGDFYSSQIMSMGRTGTVDGYSATYSIYAFFYRTSPTNLRLQVFIPNPYGSTLTGAAGDETFTFFASTFIPPYV